MRAVAMKPHAEEHRGWEAAWDGYWYGAVAAVRPYLLVRSFLLLLAFDVWLLLVPHGARYGAGGFNVAHFAWLDAVQPLPSAGLYTAVLVLAGMLAFTAALTGERASIAALAALYTYGWAMSLLDGFQHHYLLSLFLLGFALLPPLGAADADRRVSAWAHRLLSVTLAIVYVFAAASKYEGRWRNGGPLASLASGRPPFDTLQGLATSAGMSSAGFWTAASLGVTAIELLSAAADLLATRRRARRSPWLRRLGWAALASALLLHLEATVLRLQIGLFSAYMILAALTFFLPEAWLERVAEPLARAGRSLQRAAGARVDRAWAVLAAAAAGAGAWVLAGNALDLPGAPEAAAGAVGAILIAAGFALARRRYATGVRYGLAGAAAAAACVAAVGMSAVRFDFYRYLGAELERQNDLGGALAAFEKAERYAPEAQSRRAKIEDLRRRLGRGR